MTTLMHFPEDEVPRILSAMTAPLRPGAPLLVGVWGGDQGHVISEVGIAGHQRLFSRPDKLGFASAVGANAPNDDQWHYVRDEIRSGTGSAL